MPRHRLLHDRRARARRATPSRSTRTGATAARSTRSTRAASCSTASTGCARDWRTPRRPPAPAAGPAGHRRHPLRRRRGLARDDPRPRGDRHLRADRAPAGRRAAAGRATPATRSRPTCAAGATTDSWLAEHPPTFRWHTEVNPSETPVDAPSVQALLGANAALGLPRQARRARQLVRRRDVRAGGGHARADVRTALDRLGPHRGRARPVDDLVRVREGHRDRGVEAVPVNVRAAVLRAPGAAVEITEVELEAPHAGRGGGRDRRGRRVRVRRPRRDRRLGRADAGGARATRERAS